MTDKIKVSLDMDTLTLGDLELFEEACGGNLLEAIAPKVVRDPETGKPVKDPDDPKGRPLTAMQVDARTMVALVYVALKKTNPDMSLAEAKAIPLSRLDFEMENVPVGDESDPTESPENEPTDEPAD